MYSAFAFGIAVVFLVGLPVNQALPAPTQITEWPAECKDKTYCTVKPENFPEKIFEEMMLGWDGKLEERGGMENRSSDANAEDVASCHSSKWMAQVYLIKDDNENIRLVAQSPKLQIKVQIEECRTPGRTLQSKALARTMLEKNRVDCYETKLPMRFMVLSLDGQTLESVAPKGGIPSSCSAKLMRD